MSFNRSAQNVQLTGGNLIIVDIDKKIRSSKYEFANGGSDGAGTSVNLQDVTEQGASTDRTVTFSNVTTAFTTTSNVGIGTTSLTSRLTVQGAAAAPGVLSALRLRNSSDGGIGLHFDNSVCNLANIEARVTSTGAGTDNGILSFSTSNNTVIEERMRITSDGNVSIGNPNSYGKLSVVGDSSTVLDSFNIGTAATSNGVVSTVYNLNQTVGSYAGMRLVTRSSSASQWGIFNKSTGEDAGNLVFTHGSGGSGAERMAITSGGNVGIGTTNPLLRLDTRLSVPSGTVGPTANSYPIASFIGTNPDGASRGLEIGVPTGNVTDPSIYLKRSGTSSRFCILNQSDVEQFTILDGGNVGIGTKNPLAKLQVNGTALITTLTHSITLHGVKVLAFDNVTTTNINLPSEFPLMALYAGNVWGVLAKYVGFLSGGVEVREFVIGRNSAGSWASAAFGPQSQTSASLQTVSGSGDILTINTVAGSYFVIELNVFAR